MKKLFLISFFALFAWMGAQAKYAKIHIDTPGTLDSIMALYDATTDSLEISGLINDDEITTNNFGTYGYCRFSQLTYLNLENLSSKTNAFLNCYGNTTLKTVILPRSLIYMPYTKAFRIKTLEKVVFTGSAADSKKWNSQSFAYTKVKEAVFPVSSTFDSIPDYFYSTCPLLKSIVIPENVKTIGQFVFDDNSSLIEYTVPSHVKTMRNGCFRYNLNLKYFQIPSTVKSIRGGIFNGDSSLVALKVMHKIPVDISTMTYVFTNVKQNTCKLYVPKGSKIAYGLATFWKDFKNIVELDSVIEKSVEITAGGLQANLSAEEIEITTRLKIKGSVDARDFKFMRDQMPYLEDIDLSEASIEAYSGADSSLLRSASVAYPANTIPFNALKAKSGLRALTLPASLLAIGDSAFWGCTQLKLIDLRSSTPVDLNETGKALEYISTSSCQIIVPKDAVPAYRSANTWKSFSLIEESAATTEAKQTTSVDDVKVSVIDGVVKVNGLALGAQVSVYDLSGNVLYNNTAKEGELSLPISQTGVYILKGGSAVVKFIR